jgi:hypothetical protein
MLGNEQRREVLFLIMKPILTVMQPFIALGITLALVRNTTRPYFAIKRQDGSGQGRGKTCPQILEV